jgi:hypothetical protein
MTRKPTTMEGYPSELADEARRMCLYVATIVGDLLEEIVVVGGLVPCLIVEQDAPDIERHVGTRDLDLGLSFAVLDDERYKQISARLRDHGFEPGRNEDGNETRQKWVLAEERIAVDFLIGQTNKGPEPGKIQNLERDFAAVVIAALPLAFVDYVVVRIDDRTPRGELATREVKVCGPAAFVVLKAHALRLRGENKDAYDLIYTLMSFGAGVEDVVERFASIAEQRVALEALSFLKEDFASEGHVGPKRAAAFRTDRAAEDVQADAFGYVAEFLRQVASRT